MSVEEKYNTPNSSCCGRPMEYAKEPQCNYTDVCMDEYCCPKLGSIKETEPDCKHKAVIPSVTVDSVEGITNLANCFVHVNDINTTFYIDDKHRVMITWAGPVDIPGYDMKHNPEGFRDQIVTDKEKNIAVIYDKHGKGYTFGIEQGYDITQIINNKLEQMGENGELQDIIQSYLDAYAMVVFDTVADMKASTALSDGSYAKTLGYYAKDDLGGAFYKIREKESGESANERDLVAIGDDLLAEIVLTDTMNVKQFGAKGDGVTDDTAILSAVFTYSRDTDVKKIIFPEGTYNISGTIRVYSNTIVEGMGRGTTIIKMTPDTTMTEHRYTMYFNNATSLKVTGITFEGAKSPSDYTIVEDKLWNSLTLGYSSDITVEDCEFRYYFTSGISIRNSSDVFINNCVFTSNGWSDIAITRLTDNIKITNNRFTNVCARGVNAEDGTVDQPCSNILISGNTFKTLNTGNTTRAISFSNSSLSGDVHRYTKIVITDNTIDGLWEGIIYNYAKDVIVSNNVANVARFIGTSVGDRTSYNERISINHNQITPEHTHSGGKYAIVSANDKNIIIQGNTINGGATDHSITMTGVLNGIIDNNIIIGSGKAGIRTTGTNVSLTNNEITDATTYGISVDAANVDIINNRIINTGSHGIDAGGSSNKNHRINGNYIFNPTEYGICFYTGTGNKFTVIRNNWFGEDRVTPTMTYAVYARIDIDYVVIENTYLLSNVNLKNSSHWGSNCYFRNNDGFGTLPA